jgi:hypothetical protein
MAKSNRPKFSAKSRHRKSKANANANANALKLFGPPLLIYGEDPRAYNDLLMQVSRAVKPKDFFEKCWVQDFVYLTWDILRWRRAKSDLLNSNLHHGREAVFKRPRSPAVPLPIPLRGFDLETWNAKNATGINQVNAMVAGNGSLVSEVIAETIAHKIPDLEWLERTLTIAETRRNTVLRDIERHRASLAQALRRATEDVEDAEFVEIKPANERNEASRD